MNEDEIFNKMNDIAVTPQFSIIFGEDSDQSRKLAEHKEWLQRIRHERPSTEVRYKVGIYIRYFNQTKYEDYLSYHKKQFVDTVGLCPNWTMVDFYVDEGSGVPNMESSHEWSRLLNDCFDGKVDLIITQKVSNVSKRVYEITFCARLLAAQSHPIGIYFISEDIFTLASYYREDLKDTYFLPSPDWKVPLDDENKVRGILYD
jgi:hypothetical protein